MKNTLRDKCTSCLNSGGQMFYSYDKQYGSACPGNVLPERILNWNCCPKGHKLTGKQTMKLPLINACGHKVEPREYVTKTIAVCQNFGYGGGSGGECASSKIYDAICGGKKRNGKTNRDVMDSVLSSH